MPRPAPQQQDIILDKVFIECGDAYMEPPAVDEPRARGGFTLGQYQAWCDAMEPGRRVTTLDLQALSHEEARVILGWVLWDMPHER